MPTENDKVHPAIKALLDYFKDNPVKPIVTYGSGKGLEDPSMREKVKPKLKEPLLERLLSKLFENHDIIKPDGTYLRRWFIATTRWGCIYLHKIMRSDMDQDPHDHPWDFTSIILWGGYQELRWLRARNSDTLVQWFETHHPIKIVSRTAEDIHQVKLFYNSDYESEEQPAWTLVFRGTYRRHWNFVCKGGSVLWRKYLNYWGPDTLDPITKGDIRLSDPLVKEKDV